MKIVFICGPYSGEVTANIFNAGGVAKTLWLMGIPNVCPHLNSQYMENNVPYEMFCEGYTEIMKRCDIVMAIPGWEKSRGAREEHAVAVSQGIPIVYTYKSVEYAVKNYDEVKQQAISMIPLGKRLESRSSLTP